MREGCSWSIESPSLTARRVEEGPRPTTGSRYGVELATLAPELPDTGPVAIAPTEGRAAFEGADALAQAAGVPCVTGRAGHGWDLLVDPVIGSITRVGRRSMAFAQGSPGA